LNPLTAPSVRALRSVYHFSLHSVVKLNPRLSHLRSKCGTKLSFQAPYQRIAKGRILRWGYSKPCMLPGGVANDRVKHCAVIDGTNDGGNRIHQLQMLSFHVLGKQTTSLWSGLKKSVVKSDCEVSP